MGKPHRFEDKMNEMQEIEKFKKKLMGAILKLHILQSINEEPQYGYILRDMMSDIFGIPPSKASCYTKLNSLQRGGFLDSESTKIFPPLPLPHRRYYTITKKGKELLDAMLTYLDDVSIQKKEKDEEINKPRKQFIHPTS